MALSLDILPAGAIDPPSWDAFIEAAPEGGLFSLYAYLTTLRPDWQAAIVSENKVWQAVLPFAREHKFGFRRIGQPAFTQYWGPAFRPVSHPDTYRHYSWKRKILQAFLAAWENDHLVIMNCSPAFDYPMPFFEAAYEIHTRYTYQLDLRKPEKQLWQEIASTLRRKIRKADRADVTYSEGFEASELLNLYDFQAKAGHDILAADPRSQSLIPALMKVLSQQGETFFLACRNADMDLFAGACFTVFQERCYYLFGTYDPHHCKGGEMANIMWRAIVKARESSCHTFDFEGSMIPGVARFFRRFGSHPVPYLQLRKNALPLPMRWINKFR